MRAKLFWIKYKNGKLNNLREKIHWYPVLSYIISETDFLKQLGTAND